MNKWWQPFREIFTLWPYDHMTFWYNAITFAITLASITVALWLGLFLATRAGRSVRVWLSALTAWAIGSWLVHNVLQVSLPNQNENVWLFWLGQAIKFAPTLWFQLSYHILQETTNVGQSRLRLMRWVAIAGYALSFLQIVDTGRGFGSLATPNQIPSYAIFLVLLAVLPLWTMWNFYQARLQTHSPNLRRQLLHLLVATAVTYVGGLYTGLAIYLGWPLNFFPNYAIFGVGVILLGYGVVAYDSLLAGRSIERDALYSITGVGLVTILYTLVAWALWLNSSISIGALIIFLICAVVSHTLSDAGRTLLDRIFYRGRMRKLRLDLQQLAHETGRTNSLPEQLDLVLESICRSVGVQDGFIAVRQDHSQSFVITNCRNGRWRGRAFGGMTLVSNDVVELAQAGDAIRSEVEGMALLVPIYLKRNQIGALVLGPKNAGAPFRPEDIDYLETVGPQLANMVEATTQQEAHVRQLEKSLEQYRERERELQLQMQQIVAAPPATASAVQDMDEEHKTALVEDALRHLYDFAYLGEHALANLQIVNVYIPQATTVDNEATALGPTHLDQGKGLHALLVYALQQLRPAGAEPAASAVPPRDWYNYMILYGSYVQGELTRDIMAKLYIGEGTYNRTRRRALHSVAKMIVEMEKQVKAQRPAARIETEVL